MDKMDPRCYNSRVLVHLDRIGKNIEKIRKYTGGCEPITVIKSNAYGLGTTEVANYVVKECGIRTIATARVFEALQILSSGCTEADIILLSPVPEYQIPVVAENGLLMPVFRLRDAELLSEAAKKLGIGKMRMQLKIETGMNRIGVKPGEDLKILLDGIRKLENLEIYGVFTHFATADEAYEGKGNDYTRLQLSRFKEALAEIRAEGIEPKIIHCCNTGGVAWVKEGWEISTHVRCGSMYLGYSSIMNDWNPIGVEESASWRALIVNIVELKPGESCGYGRAFMPDHPAKVAVISVGYGDGYTRSFAAHGAPCLIGGKRCHFVSTAMDMSFVDVTGVDCKIGDEVTLFGEDGHGNCIKGLEIGHLMGETRLAMFTHITERVERVYIR